MNEKELEEGINHEMEYSKEEGLFPGQRQTHLLRAQIYAILLLVEVLRK